MDRAAAPPAGVASTTNHCADSPLPVPSRPSSGACCRLDGLHRLQVRQVDKATILATTQGHMPEVWGSSHTAYASTVHDTSAEASTSASHQPNENATTPALPSPPHCPDPGQGLDVSSLTSFYAPAIMAAARHGCSSMHAACVLAEHPAATAMQCLQLAGTMAVAVLLQTRMQVSMLRLLLCTWVNVIICAALSGHMLQDAHPLTPAGVALRCLFWKHILLACAVPCLFRVVRSSRLWQLPAEAVRYSRHAPAGASEVAESTVAISQTEAVAAAPAAAAGAALAAVPTVQIQPCHQPAALQIQSSTCSTSVQSSGSGQAAGRTGGVSVPAAGVAVQGAACSHPDAGIQDAISMHPVYVHHRPESMQLMVTLPMRTMSAQQGTASCQVIKHTYTPACADPSGTAVPIVNTGNDHVHTELISQDLSCSAAGTAADSIAVAATATAAAAAASGSALYGRHRAAYIDRKYDALLQRQEQVIRAALKAVLVYVAAPDRTTRGY